MKKKNRLLRIGIFLAFFFALSLGTEAWAATIVTNTSGNWSDPDTWVGGALPTASDVVQIEHDLTLDGDYTCAGIVIDNDDDGDIDLKPATTGTYTLTVNGNITMASTTDKDGILYNNTNGRLNLKITGTSVITTSVAADGADGIQVNDLIISGTVTHTGAHQIDIYNNMYVNGGGSFTDGTSAGNIISFAGADSYIYNTSSASAPLVFYDLTFAAAATDAETNASFTVKGTLTTAGGSALTATAGTITFSPIANDVVIASSGTTTLNNIVIANTTYDVTSTGDISIDGSYTQSGTTGTVIHAAAGRITFSGSGTITVPTTASTPDFGFVTIDGTYVLEGSIDVLGASGTDDFNVDASDSFIANSGTVSVTSNGAQIDVEANATCTFYDLSIGTGTAAETQEITATSIITVTNDLTVAESGVAVASSDANSPAPSITMTGGTAIGSAVTLDLSGIDPADVGFFNPGNLYIGSGAFVEINTHASGWELEETTDDTLHVRGTFIVPLGNKILGDADAGDVHEFVYIYSGATLATSCIGGLFDDSNTGDAAAFDTDDGTADLTFAFEDISATNFYFYPVGTNFIQFGDDLPSQQCGNLTLAPTGSAMDATFTQGNFTVNGNFITAGTQDVVFTATTDLTLAGSNNTITHGSSGNLTFGLLSITGSYSTDDDFEVAAAGAAAFDATGGTFLATTPSNITLTGAAPQIDAGTITFYDLTIGDGTAACAAVLNNDITITGDLILGDDSGVGVLDGSLTAASQARVTFDNTASAVSPNHITVGAENDIDPCITFNNLTIAANSHIDVTTATSNILFTDGGAAAGITLGSGSSFVWSAGTLQIGSGTTAFGTTITVASDATLTLFNIDIFDIANNAITTDDSFIINGAITSTGDAAATSFTASSPSVITFGGSTTMDIAVGATGSLTFYDVIVNNTSTLGLTITTGDALTISGDLTVNSSAKFIPAADATVTFSGTDNTIVNNGTLTLGLTTFAASSDYSLTGNAKFAGGAGTLTLGANASLTQDEGAGTITIENALATIVIPATASLAVDNLTITNAAPQVTTGDLTIKGDITNSDAANAGLDGTTTFSGTENQSISGNAVDFETIIVNKASGDLKLSTDIVLNSGADGDLTLTSGNLDLNGDNTVTIPQTNSLATLSETAGAMVINSNTSATSGYIEAESGGTDGNVGGLGLSLVDVDATDIVRRYPIADLNSTRNLAGSDAVGISRYYYVQEVAGNGITSVGSVFRYDDSEINGGSEANLSLYHSDNNAAYAVVSNASVNTSTNSFTGPAGMTAITASQTDYFTFGVASGIKYSDVTTSGNWNDASSWSPTGVPTSTDLVVIKNTHTILLNTDATVSGLEIQGTGALKPAATGEYDLTCSGNVFFSNASAVLYATNGAGKLNLTMTGGNATTPKKIKLLANANFNVNDLTVTGYLEQDGAYTIDVSGDLYTSGASSFVQRVGSTNFNGTIQQTVTRDDAATLTFNNVVVADNANVTTSDSFTVLGNFTNGSAGTATFESTGGTITLSGTTAITNATSSTLEFYGLSFPANAAATTSSNFTVHGDFTLAADATFAASAGAVTFDNTATADITNNSSNSASDLTFWNVKVTTGSKVETASDFYYNGTGTSIEIQGTGSYKQTSGTTYFSASSAISNSSAGTLEFSNISIPTGVAMTTTSDFSIKGNLTVASTGTLVASNPSNITFDNTTAAINLDADDLIDFWSLTVADETELTVSDWNYDIQGNLTVLGSGSLVNSNNLVKFIEPVTKTITNNGTLEFYDLEIENNTSRVVNTTSDFTINGTLTVGVDATTGSLICSGNSTITLNYAGASPTTNGNLEGEQLALQFQNVKFTAAATPAAYYVVSGDFISNDSYHATAGEILFDGSSEQTIKGSTAPYFDEIEVDGSGVKLEVSIYIDGTIDALLLTDGDMDLNGDNIITFTATGAELDESDANTVKNTGIGSGYITTVTSGDSEPNIEASGFGLTFDAGSPTGIVVRRYHNALNINTTSTVERYYYITFTGGAVTGVTFDYDNTELNGNTATNLSLYKASASTATSWTGIGGTANGGTYTGNIAKTSGISGLTTGDFLAATSQAVTIAAHPTEGVHENNLMAASPLIASAQNKNILGFSLTSTGTTDFTGIDMTLNIDPSAKLSNFELYVDDDNDLSSYGMTKIGNVTQNGTSLQFTGFTQTLSAATAKYYFLVADVSSVVSSSTPQIFASFTQDDLTLSAGTANSNNFQGTAYSFDQLLVTVATDNAPSAGSLTQALADQAIFGFNLTPNLNSPNVSFTAITIDADLDGGAPTSDFTTFKLYRDRNNNGVKDDYDILLSTVGAMPGNQQIAFTGLSESFNEEINYIVVCTIISSATDNGTIQMQISDINNITLTSPALLDDDAPYEGNVMTIAAVAAATKLVITDVSPDISFAANQGLAENTLVDGQLFTVTVQAQDASGNPQKLTAANNVTISNTGASSLGGTLTQDMNGLNSYTFYDLILHNSGKGESGIVLSAADVETLTDATSSALTLLSKEQTTSLSGLAISAIQPTQVTASWTNTLQDECILVVKAGSAPTDPTDGTEYGQATANNFSTPNAVNGTTGTGSVVVYKGTGETVNVTGLTAGTTYYFALYNYYDQANVINYRITAEPENSIILVSETTLDTEPTVPASSIAYSGVTSTSMRLTWTRGNGENNIVVARAGSAAPSPTDGTTYGSSTAYGAATAAISTGYVVYDGTANTAEITNLIPNTEYYFAIYEYSGSGDDINYLTTGAVTGNRYTLVSEPTAQAHDITFSEMTQGTNNEFKVNWVNGNGDYRIVVAKAASAITASETPVDASIYTSNVVADPVTYGTTEAIGDGYIIYNNYGSSNTNNYITLQGLTYGQTYYFKVFEFNGTGTTADDSKFNYLTDDATDNPSSREADSYEDNNTLANAVQITADGTLYQGIISSATDEDWLYFTPDIANNLNNVRIKLTSLPKDYTIEVYTSAGRLVRSSKRTGTTDEIIVINNLPVGDYYIKIYSPSGDYSLTPYRVNAVSSTADYKSDTP